MNIELPNGQVLMDIPDGTTKEQIAAKLKSAGHEDWLQKRYSVADVNSAASKAAANQKPEDLGTSGQRFLAGAGKEFVNIGRGAEQIGAKAGEKLGVPGSQNLEQSVQKKIDEEAPIQRQLASTTAGKLGALTGDVAIAAPTFAIPGVNTLAGSALVGSGFGAIQPTETGESRLKNIAEGAAGGVGGYGLGRGIGAVAKVGKGYLENTKLAESLMGTRQAVVQLARKYRIRLTPSLAGDAPVGELAETLTGVPNLQQGAVRINQRISNDVAKTELGLPKNRPISESVLNDAKKQPWDAYKQVENIGRIDTGSEYKQALGKAAQPFSEMGQDFPEAANDQINKLVQAYDKPSFSSKGAVQAIRQLRKDGAKNMKIYDPEKNAMGLAQKRVATALEDQIDRHLQMTDNPELMQNFRAARTKLAQIHSVEDALEPDTGNINPIELAKQVKHGVPLSGGLKDLADLATNFPQVMKTASKTPHWGPFSRWDMLVGSYAALKHDPLLLGAIAARPVVKKAILSDLYQSRLTGEPGGKIAKAAIGAISKIPKDSKLLKALPALGAEAATPGP